MSEQEFWRLTPCKLFAIVDARNQQSKKEDYRVGILTMVVRAALGERNAHPFDFFPHHKEASPKLDRGITEASVVRNNFRAFIEGSKQYGKKAPNGS